MSVDVRFQDETYCIVLPDPPRRDPYTFLKEQLSVETCTNLHKANIEVQQIGSDVPANMLWPTARALKQGTYRVTVMPGAGDAGTAESSSWQATIRIDTVNHSGYWPNVSGVPQLLHLQLHGKKLTDAEFNSMQRLPGYTADDCLLEYSFYQYFPEGDWQLNFVADANLKGQSLQVQDTYLKKLYERKLMLRITNFSTCQELLLRPRSSGRFSGFVRPSGVIETIAQDQFQSFMGSKQLVLVLDLDGTLVHTAEEHEREDFRACQYAVELHRRDQHEPWFCIPRARLLEFFLQVIWKYHIMFCTAGLPEYAEAMIDKLRETLLNSTGLTAEQQHRITHLVDSRHLISNHYTSNRQLKTLGMMLPVGHVPYLAEKLFVILDDRTDVWRESDRKLYGRLQNKSHLRPTLHQRQVLSGMEHGSVQYMIMFSSMTQRTRSHCRTFKQQACSVGYSLEVSMSLPLS